MVDYVAMIRASSSLPHLIIVVVVVIVQPLGPIPVPARVERTRPAAAD